MADQQANSSLSPDKTRPVSSFLHSPRFFNGFFSTKTLDSEPSPSPTSILDLHGNSVNNPFEISKSLAKPTKILKEIKHPSEKFDHEGIALALVEEQNDVVKPNAVSRKVLFGSNLKIQIPPSVLSSPGSPQSPGDYGIKTRSSQVSSGLTGLTPTGVGSGRNLTGRLSWSEMELSEEYTRVVCHGPNPKTTHIYDNCVVESCCGGVGSPEPEFEKPGPKSPCASFLSLCHTCNKNLEEDSVIFIYRGKKAFCSEECRCQEMVLDGLIDVK